MASANWVSPGPVVACIIDSEYAGFIAVEDHRFTVFLDIATCSFKIGKCGLRFHKQQVHQATGGIVNIDRGSTGSTPVFKPVVVAAINLYQLASTRAPVTRLMNFRCALSAGNPESGLYHEASDGFLPGPDRELPPAFPALAWGQNHGSAPDYTECLICQ